MGWSWAFWRMQRAHLEIVRRAGMPDDQIALASWSFPSLRDHPVEVLYCDNITMVGTKAGRTLKTRGRILGQFREEGVCYA